jgi:nucleotide-binding universal stress UspA family protein
MTIRPHDDGGFVPPAGGGGIQLRLLVGLDERESIRDLVAYVQSIATGGQAVARVVHVIDHAFPSGFTLETPEEARDLVDEAVFELQMAGVGAEPVVRHSRMGRVGLTIVGEASQWAADRIVLGGRRGHLFGSRVREQVLRRAPDATVIAPTIPGDQGQRRGPKDRSRKP